MPKPYTGSDLPPSRDTLTRNVLLAAFLRQEEGSRAIWTMVCAGTGWATRIKACLLNLVTGVIEWFTGCGHPINIHGSNHAVTENHHGQPKDDEATMTERVRQAQEADWETDPDWQAFQSL